LPPSYIIREARPEDAPRVIAYLKNVLSEPNHNLLSTPEEFAFTVEQERDFIASMAAADNSLMLVGEADGQIIAALTCQGGKRQSQRRTGLIGITVAQAWRGHGVGTALLNKTVGWARSSGILHRLELYVFTRNTRAVNLYQRIGFQHEGTLRQAIYKDGEFLDEHVMGLIL
jgi:RimJ/RimL family protein N-acetyltransferase